MKGMKAVGRYGSVGFELLASIAVGYYLGKYLDGKFGTRWIALVGFLIGCYAGFRSLFRAAKTMQRDIEREERMERGEDPWAPPRRDDEDENEDDARARERAAEDGRSIERRGVGARGEAANVGGAKSAGGDSGKRSNGNGNGDGDGDGNGGNGGAPGARIGKGRNDGGDSN